MDSMGKAATKVVAFQGELGAFSHLAVLEFFGKKVKLLPLPKLQDVFEFLSKASEFAVIPIENSRSGDIGETIDFLNLYDCRIVGEIVLPIKQCLIIHKKSDISKVKKVISHPQALAQCTKFLSLHGKDWQTIPYYDTAGAVKMISETSALDTAAVASELACKIYGMKLVKKGIEDDPKNMTRFLVITDLDKDSLHATNAQFKTSLIFYTAHKPGSLVMALKCLSDRGINLLKIVSRPIEGRHWEYSFYVEFEGSVKDERCSDAVEELKDKTTRLKVLGSYPKHKVEQ
jgi:prephenate dehydratase